jgi:hypothetical protein
MLVLAWKNKKSKYSGLYSPIFYKLKPALPKINEKTVHAIKYQ